MNPNADSIMEYALSVYWRQTTHDVSCLVELVERVTVL